MAKKKKSVAGEFTCVYMFNLQAVIQKQWSLNHTTRPGPEPQWTTPGLNLTVAAVQSQVIYLLHRFRISLPTALCQASAEPMGPLERQIRPEKSWCGKQKRCLTEEKHQEKIPLLHVQLCCLMFFSQAVLRGAELTRGDGRKPGRERKRTKVKFWLAYGCDNMTCSVS